MVYRIFVEKKDGFDHEAKSLLSDARELLELSGIERIRIINRYDAEDIEKPLFDACVKTVFSEPQMDRAAEHIDLAGARVFAVEYLPGQFDQRADSAAQCIQLVSKGKRPLVRTAKLYAVYGDVSDEALSALKKYVINPVESREASLALPETLHISHPVPSEVETLHGFLQMEGEALPAFVEKYALAMDEDDIRFCRDYFRKEGRDPTLTEIRMIDTYWSDHCRHTTFLTTVDGVTFDDPLLQSAYEEYLAARKELDRTKPINLMDIGTLAAKVLKKRGMLEKLDESEEINACTVKIKVDIDGKAEDWLLLFKNETHNHPTEIEPFGGAATCIGGAIRDPLSGRSYVYAAMRVTGAGDPLVPVRDTMKGKLPQRKIVTTAAAGYSSYGNQIGLATGQVDELYHSGYVAKRLEIGAVIAATPAENVRREVPSPGDLVILLGGRTGRDGCGGATGSSKSHTLESLTHCGAEVQKGNAPEERKLQRLFRNKEAPAPLPQQGGDAAHQALQRLRRGRRVRRHRRACRRPYDRPQRCTQEVRRSRRHRTCHLRIAGAHGGRRRSGQGGALHRARGQGKFGGDRRCRSDQRAPPRDDVERQDHRRRFARVFKFQRRGKAYHGGGAGLQRLRAPYA